MCPARRTVNVTSICPASVNHVSYRVRSRGFSLAGRPLQAALNVTSICPASVNHVSYRVRSRGFSLAGRPLQAAQIATQTFLDSRHNPTALA